MNYALALSLLKYICLNLRKNVGKSKEKAKFRWYPFKMGCGYFHGIRNFIILTEVNLRMRCMTAGEFREWIFSEFESFFRQQSRLPNTTVKYQNNNVTAVLLNCFRPNNKNHIAWDSLALAKIIVDI